MIYEKSPTNGAVLRQAPCHGRRAEPHCVQGTCAKECLCRPPPPLAAAVRVGMLVSSPVDMDVRLDQYVGRHQHYPAVPYPALGDHVLGEMLDLVSLAAQDRDLH